MRITVSTRSATLLLPVVIAIPVLSLSAHAVPGPATVFAVREANVGDLNGDGDTVDSVWHVYDAKEDTTTNLGMAAASVCSDSFLPPPLLLCVPMTITVVEKKTDPGAKLHTTARWSEAQSCFPTWKPTKRSCGLAKMRSRRIHDLRPEGKV